MGSGSSRFVALSDVSRVRDRLLVALRSRGGSQPLREWLTARFERYDKFASGTVTLNAVSEIASELSLHPPLADWSADETAQFCAFFAREDVDSATNAFDYRLFVDYLLFPVLQSQPQVEISASDTNAAGFQVGVYSTGNDSGQEHDRRSVTIKAVASLESVEARAEAMNALRDAVNSLRLLSHPNLVSYRATLHCKSTLYVLQMHEQKSCTLRTILESFGPMKEPTVRRYLGQLLQGLLFLHQHGISHGALSAQSVLIDSYGLLKLSDFGIRRYQSDQKLWDPPSDTSTAGEVADWCLQFQPPEMEASSVWGLKSDVWSVGVLALQMTYGYCSVSNESQRSSTARSPSSPSPTRRVTIAGHNIKTPAVRRPPALPSTASKELKALVRACLQKRPSKRATVSELLCSPYFHVDQTQATREELRSVCTDLDASMRRLLSVSSPGTRAGARKDMNSRRATTGR